MGKLFCAQANLEVLVTKGDLGSDFESEAEDEQAKTTVVADKWTEQQRQEAVENLLGSCAGSDFEQEAEPAQVRANMPDTAHVVAAQYHPLPSALSSGHCVTLGKTLCTIDRPAGLSSSHSSKLILVNWKVLHFQIACATVGAQLAENAPALVVATTA